MADKCDFCKADEGKLATARSRMPQLPLRFSDTSHTAKMFVFLAASVLKVKKFQPSPGKLVARLEADCMTIVTRTPVS